MLLTLPLLAGYRRMVESISRSGDGVGHALGVLQQPWPLALEQAPLPLPDAGSALPQALPPAVSSADFVRGVAPKPAPKGMRSILISEQTVLRLANAGVVPGALDVAAQAKRPAGIQLSGVSAMGVGLLDGDILVQVAGVPVKRQTQVAAIVRAARERKVHSINARVWRNGETIALTVGMPYLSSR